MVLSPPSRAQLSTLLILLGLPLFIVACHEAASESGPTGLTQLDPTPSAEPQDVEVKSWTFKQDAGGLGPWSYAGPAASKGPGGGFRTAGTGKQPPRFTLDFPRGVEDPFDLIAFDIAFDGACTSRVTLKFDDGSRKALDFPTRTRTEQTPLRFYIGAALADHPGRELRQLSIQPSVDAVRPMEVMGVRFLRRGLEDISNDRTGHDQGLVEIGGQHRRVWSASGGVLTTRAKIEGHPKLDVTLWPSDAVRRTGAALWGRVEVVPAGSDAQPVTVAEGRLEPGQVLGAGLHITGELGAFEGKEVELRFSSGTSAAGPAPGRVAGLWQSPSLVRQRDPRTPPNVILITLDTTRADFAANEELAPNLARLAGEGLSFKNAWSPCNTTSPSHASIFTGLLPHTHGTLAVGKYPLRSEVLAMAELFRANGYATAAATSVEHIDVAHGFGQGFDTFLDGTPGGSMDGRVALDAAREFLGQSKARSREPFFLWVHWFDVHTPYRLPDKLPADFQPPTQAPELPIETTLPAWARKGASLRWFPEDQGLPELVADYSRGIAYVDWLVGQLVRELEDTGLMENTILAITADHGEGLGEKDIFAGHVSLYRPVLRIPLILHLPFNEALPEESLAAPVTSMDLLPTLIELARLDVPEGLVDGLDGRSLLTPDPDRVLWFESDRLTQVGRLEHGQFALSTLREVSLLNSSPARKLQPGERELYDYRTDPLMLHDEVAAGTMPAEAEAWFEESKHKLPLGENKDLSRILSPQETERLRALGYLGDE